MIGSADALPCADRVPTDGANCRGCSSAMPSDRGLGLMESCKLTRDIGTQTSGESDLPRFGALDEGYDLSSLLTFDPESIEPATSKASEESGPSATHGQLQHLKALLSSSIETLVEDPEEVKSILEDIQPHLPVTLQVKLWPVVTLSPTDKCQRLNEKKAALDAKTDTSVSTAELETLRKELEDLEERVRATKQLIQDKEALIAHSHEEAEGLKAELKTDLAEIRALNKQLVTGKDEDDEAEIAEVDRVRANALHALEAFLQ
ncbi:hypothetical protein QYE76_016759 [Lolium multiflorum]|uniref:Uncharacterized protein n=1 Tax=Lolium multiflorum TaxID=4521 RepID=A0AAD8QEK0_LOLMU|nr:hypothetical protein QYE76_016759 [Lolium multiflorum]